MKKRFKDQLLKKQLEEHLIYGPMKAAELCANLDISQPVFSRLTSQMKDRILIAGRARSTRYAARRHIPGIGMHIPIYEIGDGINQTRKLAVLHAKEPSGFYLEPETEDIQAKFFDDLPYFLDNMRQSGFLGRLIPKRHIELELPQDIQLWSTDHCLNYCVHYGWNLPGNFILGDEAFRLYLSHSQANYDTIDLQDRIRVYPERADAVLSAGPPGSSAVGEQPKFLAVLSPEPTHVLVKFSHRICDATSQRLADLLVCEHIALKILAQHGQTVAKSELLISADRVFLEVKRFDRVGAHGRRGTLSLTALDAEFIGLLTNWKDSAAALLRLHHIDQNAYDQILWWQVFGHLIANTDMHHGNLSFLTRSTSILGVAPVYDMSPMLYAPVQGQLIERTFSPPLPAPSETAIWREVHGAALDFWLSVIDEDRISKKFRIIAEKNVETVDALKKFGDLLPQ